MIIRTRDQEVERRSFALTDTIKYGYGGLRSFGGVNQRAAGGIPALNLAVRIRSQGVASLELGVWRGEGVMRDQITRTWQSRLFAAPRMNEYQTRFAFWESTEESLAYRGNAYIWRLYDPMTGQVPALYALHPDQVTCLDGGYRVNVSGGYVDPVGRGDATYEVSDETILHIRGHGDGGAKEAPSPIKVFRDALRAPISRLRHENRMWEKGAALKLGVEFPQGVSPDQALSWREQWRDTYEGADGETTAVVGGGAKLVPIGMTLTDAAYVDMAKLTTRDASQIMGVPANLLGAQLERSVPNLEQDLAMWLRFGLGPELARIEGAVHADGYLFPDGTDLYPWFKTENFIRGDLLTEDNVAHQRVQDGRMLVDEWRRTQGLPPLPGGVGMIPQIVPVGGGPNPQPIPAQIPAIPKVPAE